MNIKPILLNILVKPLENEAVSQGGILLPDSAREKSDLGEVVATSGGKDILVKVGDNIFYKKWAGTPLKHEGIDYLFVEQKDILGVGK